MTLPDTQNRSSVTEVGTSRLLRTAIWVAIGALIAAAIVCVIWVLIGSSNGIIGRAFLTILLLAAFAGVAILDAHLAQSRPEWFALTSMIVWVVVLLAGSFLIWMPNPDYGFDSGYGIGRFMSFLLIVLILQLALLHVRLYVKSSQRYVTGFTRAVTFTTIGLVTILALMLVLPLVLNEFVDFEEWYWRIVVAITILAAVGTALIPLMNVLFAPKKPRSVLPAAPQQAPAAWPTYVDGVTPLPVLTDGSPDWNAYYTGFPSAQAPEQQYAQPGYVQQYEQPGYEQQYAQPAYEQQYAQPAAEQHPHAPEAPGQTPHAPEQPPQAPSPSSPDQSFPAPEQSAPPAPPETGYRDYPPPPPLPPQQ